MPSKHFFKARHNPAEGSGGQESWGQILPPALPGTWCPALTPKFSHAMGSEETGVMGHAQDTSGVQL